MLQNGQISFLSVSFAPTDTTLLPFDAFFHWKVRVNDKS